mmetsp:Transcript_27461/g.68486  ORF Transcript_27461/g.68486 Transcript_27461/m.68486 type:complete len:119 (+) Transcript_27461:733-1089(+)
MTGGPLNGWRHEQALLKRLVADGLVHGFVTDGSTWVVVDIEYHDEEKRLYFEGDKLLFLSADPQLVMDHILDVIEKQRRGDEYWNVNTDPGKTPSGEPCLVDTSNVERLSKLIMESTT